MGSLPNIRGRGPTFKGSWRLQVVPPLCILSTQFHTPGADEPRAALRSAPRHRPARFGGDGAAGAAFAAAGGERRAEACDAAAATASLPVEGRLKWVWVKFKAPEDRRFWSMFPFTRIRFWDILFAHKCVLVAGNLKTKDRQSVLRFQVPIVYPRCREVRAFLARRLDKRVSVLSVSMC